jgi:hypothetical protein
MPGLAIVVVSSVVSGGCATTKAAAVVAGPPLAVPEAPQRMIVPAEDEPLASTSTGPNRPLTSIPQVQPNPPRPGGRVTAPRADTDARSEASAPAAVPPATAGNVEAARDSRPVAAGETNSRAQVQTLLNKAAADLKCVDPAKLSNERKTIWNESKRHSDTAVEKMKERNFLVALAAAEKAAAFAADLATPCPGR